MKAKINLYVLQLSSSKFSLYSNSLYSINIHDPTIIKSVILPIKDVNTPIPIIKIEIVICSEKPTTKPSIKTLVSLCVNFINSNCTIVKINPDNTTVKTAFIFNINNVLINAKIETINENELFCIKLLFIIGYIIGAKTNRSENLRTRL